MAEAADQRTPGGRGASKQSVAERLELELLSGHPDPGSQLESERVLAGRFGVSRPMIREVLRGLQERGLIEIHPGRGAFVRDVRVTDAVRPLDTLYRQHRPTPRDLIQARVTLERETASLAALNATEADIEALQECLDRFDRAKDLLAKARADIAFHAAVARASRNPVIELMFGSITTLTFELMLRSLGDPLVSREGVPYHQQILDAIRAADPETSRAAMIGHLNVALENYGDDLDESLDLVTQRRIEQLLDLPAE